MDEVKKSPIWKQAVDDFLASGFDYGQIVPHDWFHDHFELERPHTAQQQREWQAKLTRNLVKFRRHMLTKHLMDFENIWGSGYLIVRPSEQAAFALKDTRETVRKAIAEGVLRVVHTKADELTDAQRQENADALNKLTALQAMASPKKWLR